MRISYRWLERHLDLAGRSAEDIARDLTLHVAEVEGLERFAPALSQVSVGRVLERGAHPNADRLSLCRVDLGAGEPVEIVCGAPNVAAEQTVAVAPVGAVLPGDFEIKKATIRGQVSQGMICSEKELGLGEEHEGIWVLPDGLPVGASVDAALGGADWVLEVENKAITHRPDLWGHRGIARELAALWGQDMKPLGTSLPKAGDAEPFPVRIDTPACPRYIALPVDGVRPVRSPEWLRLLLLAAGQRPIDLLVDISNFVMLDLGQPNHLFDRGRVEAGIEVREAREGEGMQTLDGEERQLEPGDVLICSGDEPVALGGIMGGEASKVSKGTDRLLLEVANFDGTAIRRTATRLGLRTDASSRFEKALDPHLPLAAAGHLARLLQEIQPEASLPAPVTDVGDWQDPSLTIDFEPDRARRVLGLDLDDEVIAGTLERLGFEVDREAGGSSSTAESTSTAAGSVATTWRVGVPARRATKDVSIQEDLIEEVGRAHGYENMREAPIVAALELRSPDRRRALVRAAQDFLAGSPAFHEVYTYSFVPDRVVKAIGAEDQPYTEVINAIASGLDRIRRDVVPSLLGVLEVNLRQEPDLRVFEIGKGSRIEDRDDWGKPGEVHQIGLVWAAPAPGEEARFDAGSQARLKGVIEPLLAACDAPPVRWRRAEEAEIPSWAHPGRAAVAEAEAEGPEGPQALAFLADLDPLVARKLGLEEGVDTAAATVHIDAILALPARRGDYRPLPRYPGVKIDVALAVAGQTPSSELVAAIHAAGGDLVAEVELFDLYSGSQLGHGRKSLAYHVLLQSPERTLTDEDGQRFLDALAREAESLGAELRRA